MTGTPEQITAKKAARIVSTCRAFFPWYEPQIKDKFERQAWEELKEYNIQDIITLEALYLRLRPYMTGHPNVDLSDGSEILCPRCSSNTIQKRGTYSSSAGVVYQRFVCKSCGSWGHEKSYAKAGAAGRSF